MMDNIEFGPADVFEPGEIVRYWHPGNFRFVGDDMKLIGKGCRLHGGCDVKIVTERQRIEFNPTVEHSFPSITYVIEIVSDATSSHGDPVARGTRRVLSVHLT